MLLEEFSQANCKRIIDAHIGSIKAQRPDFQNPNRDSHMIGSKICKTFFRLHRPESFRHFLLE